MLSAPAIPPPKFTDVSTEQDSVNVPSTWRKEVAQEESAVQTEVVSFRDTSTQAGDQRNNATQTDPPSAKSMTRASYDQNSMRLFLQDVEPLVSRQLLANLTSTAFAAWQPRWEDEINATSCIHTLDASTGVRDWERGMLCTDISWSCKGGIVGVGLGRWDHEHVCLHKGAVIAWNVRRANGQAECVGNIEVENCVMTLAFHPVQPTLLAGATFTGQVFVARINQDAGKDGILFSTKMQEIGHLEAVAKVLWVPGEKHGEYQIMSVGNDGKILWWDLNNKLEAPIRGSQLHASGIPRHLRLGGTKQDFVLGATGFTLSKENPTQYTIVTEGGYVAKCTTTLAIDGASVRLDEKGRPQYPNPIQNAYQPHVGPVNSVAYSPFHRNLLLTAGSDGEIRLYNILQTKHLSTWEPSGKTIYCVDWSPVRATVFACASGDGMVYIYDLAKSTTLPAHTLESSAKSTIATTAVAFNPYRSDLLASGDFKSVVRIWRLKTEVSSECEPSERAIIDRFGGLGAETTGL
ncbi:WD40-repeat-containing domain protein [Gaertneriomyces semiglobifer]|nr:WD40-repeat-containing domain protein [Gaertneriomyces semiglobifer]